MSKEYLLERINKAENYKLSGNKYFIDKDIKNAVVNYNFAYLCLKGLLTDDMIKGYRLNKIDYHKTDIVIPHDRDFMDDDIIKRVILLNSQILNNLAAVHLQMKQYEKAVIDCDNGLKLDPDNAKLHFRRGQARLALRDVDRAGIDLNKSNELTDGQDPKILLELKKLDIEIKRQKIREKRIYAAMFSQ